ncbi:hypothetical protein [Paenibacillus medicaginis]|uniref:HNH endonuclease n=1 Tax=Paenibacillus medicaginis TaxID=1470560 RepID=A0ABV5C130_9BACL
MSTPFHPYSKEQQLRSKRIKHTQRQMGDISQRVDKELKDRSQGLCEYCGEAFAKERAHLTGRKQLDHKTTATDLLHVCKPCHDWLDGSPEGIRMRRAMARVINTELQKHGITS